MNRGIIRDAGGLQREMRSGDGGVANPGLPLIVTTDTDQVLTAAQFAKGGGMIYLSALSAGRALTTDTAAALLLQYFANGDIGDSVVLYVAIEDAFAGTWAAGTGVTLAGRATTAASTTTMIVVTKLSATTVKWFVF
jgi:hypothetical protein